GRGLRHSHGFERGTVDGRTEGDQRRGEPAVDRSRYSSGRRYLGYGGDRRIDRSQRIAVKKDVANDVVARRQGDRSERLKQPLAVRPGGCDRRAGGRYGFALQKRARTGPQAGLCGGRKARTKKIPDADPVHFNRAVDGEAPAK